MMIIVGRVRSERGSMSLFVAAVLLPLLFFFFTITLDLERFFRTSGDIQHALDEAALYSYRFLPNESLASTMASLYLQQNSGVSGSVTVSVASDSLRLAYHGASKLSFGGLLASVAGGTKDVGIPLSLVSEVRGSPIDAYILMDTSSYLAPLITGSTTWGAPGEWPEANLFRSQLQIRDTNGNPLNDGAVTQQCFNPVFSEIKLATIRTYQQLSNFSKNGVGVGVVPGRDGTPESIREIRPISAPTIGEATFNDSVLGTGGMSNHFCLAAAEFETATSHYRFHVSPNGLNHLWYPQTDDPMPASITVPGSWNLDPGYAPFLSMPQAVWGQKVSENRVGDISATLDHVFANLISAPSIAERGTLAGKAKSVGILLMGDLPHEGSEKFPHPIVQSTIRNRLRNIKDILSQNLIRHDSRIRLFWVISDHESIHSADFNESISLLRELLTTENSEGLRITLVSGSVPSILTEKIVESILLEGKTAVIAR